MKIMSVIMIIVGIALMAAGASICKYIPPGYDEPEEAGILKELQKVERLLKAIGMVFLIAGVLLAIVSII